MYQQPNCPETKLRIGTGEGLNAEKIIQSISLDFFYTWIYMSVILQFWVFFLFLFSTSISGKETSLFRGILFYTEDLKQF